MPGPLGTLETILVVDDSDPILEIVGAILGTANFIVLKANSGPSALKIAGDYPGRIDVLLSDVQMPGMHGPELGETLKQSRPHIHVVLMSTFPGGELLALDHGWKFIQKPFMLRKLLEMVNDVLHTPNKAHGGHQYGIRKDQGTTE